MTIDARALSFVLLFAVGCSTAPKQPAQHREISKETPPGTPLIAEAGEEEALPIYKRIVAEYDRLYDPDEEFEEVSFTAESLYKAQLIECENIFGQPPPWLAENSSDIDFSSSTIDEIGRLEAKSLKDPEATYWFCLEEISGSWRWLGAGRKSPENSYP